MAENHPKKCLCERCAIKRPFELTDDLRSSLIAGKIAIFAGAGISTEGASPLGYSLVDELRSFAKVTTKDVEFPDLCTSVCGAPNGRIKFMEILLSRFKSIRSAPEFYHESTNFHRALAPLSLIDTIVTTNWDDFFERECWATPFVFPEDTAFWAAADRKLLKIHGTIENLGSIVATRQDYTDCEARLSTGIIGSRLKVILSEKTVVFCGYSLRDPDFREILRFVKTEMNGFGRQSYIVTPDEKVEGDEFVQQMGIFPVITDGTYFIEQLYETWRSVACVAPRSLYAEAKFFGEDVKSAHIDLTDRINMFDFPEVLMCMFYQDGLIHALDRISLHYKSGAYSDLHVTHHKISNYENLKKVALRRRAYGDVAYIEGYLSGLIFASLFEDSGDDVYPPQYWLFGDRSFSTIDELIASLEDASLAHAPSLKWATRVLESYERSEGFVLDHRFMLNGVLSELGEHRR